LRAFRHPRRILAPGYAINNRAAAATRAVLRQVMISRARKSIFGDDMANATNMLTAAQALAAAVMLRQANRPAEAERLYRAVLVSNPEQFDSLHGLGVLLLQRNAPQ
jgi:hypothetical protein